MVALWGLSALIGHHQGPLMPMDSFPRCWWKKEETTLKEMNSPLRMHWTVLGCSWSVVGYLATQLESPSWNRGDS